uniref:Uncharacterized protein n=1 Tax=viral metagenome TaxID=1070528 RepID=A0A6C0AT78_9ZZZZ
MHTTSPHEIHQFTPTTCSTRGVPRAAHAANTARPCTSTTNSTRSMGVSCRSHAYSAVPRPYCVKGVHASAALHSAPCSVTTQHAAQCPARASRDGNAPGRSCGISARARALDGAPASASGARRD